MTRPPALLRPLALLAAALLAAPAARAEPLRAASAAGDLVAFQEGDAARIELPGAGALSLPLPPGAELHALAAAEGGWLLAGTVPAAGGAERRLFLRAGDARGARPLPPPAGQEGGLRHAPVPLVTGERLAGLAWLEGDDLQSLGVRASIWRDGRWSAPEGVSGPGPGSQLGLAAAVLADGAWLLAWSAFDGEDDEIVWARRTGSGWSPAARVSADNRVPDISPALAPLGAGALLAWSRYDGNDYRLTTARFAGGGWVEERRVGGPGSLYPRIVATPAGARLTHLDAATGGRTVLELDRRGRVERRSPSPPELRRPQPAPSPQVEGRVRYVAFGDSITEGEGDDPDRAEPGYPPRLEALLRADGADAVVENRGLGGERTPEGLTRIDSVLAEGGDVVLLMEGSNDITLAISVETTRFNLHQMALKAELTGMEAIQATLIPRIPTARRDSRNLINQRLCELIRHTAGIWERRLVDNFEVFSTIDDAFSRLYWDDPVDGVGHPNAAGYDVMARTFYEVISGIDTVPPVTGVLNPVNGARDVPADALVAVDVWDFGEGIDVAATGLSIDGQPVAADVNGNARKVELRYRHPVPLEQVVSVGLRSRDLAVPPNVVDREVARFVIAGADFLPGDIDLSGRVDGADLVALARRFGSRQGDGRYDPDADLNEDGFIDGEDLAILASNFGQSSF